MRCFDVFAIGRNDPCCNERVELFISKEQNRIGGRANSTPHPLRVIEHVQRPDVLLLAFNANCASHLASPVHNNPDLSCSILRYSQPITSLNTHDRQGARKDAASASLRQ